MTRLLAEYGPLVLIVYLSIFALTLVTFAWGIERGLGDSIDRWVDKIGGWIPWLSDERDSDGSFFGRVGKWFVGWLSRWMSPSAMATWGAAWVATKLTQPLRIAATIAITALLHRVWRERVARKRG